MPSRRGGGEKERGLEKRGNTLGLKGEATTAIGK